jgi:hypothetical protein
MLSRSIIESSLFALNSRDNLARVPTGTELEVPDSLPGTSSQTTIGDRDVHRSTDESRLDMSLAQMKELALLTHKYRAAYAHRTPLKQEKK